LFVGIDLPPEALAPVVGIVPAVAPGVRPTAAGNIHLTLHFLGEFSLLAATSALSGLRCSPFPLTLEKVGAFESRGRAPVLWAGVRESAALRELHAAVGSVLSGCGFIPEEREYSPHITLARCTAKVPRGWVAEQVARHRDFVTPTVMVEAVTLFSSDTRPEGPVYTRQVVVPLGA
jgi:2'-5' RNA ligase